MNSVQPPRSRGKSFPLILMVTCSLILAGALFWLSQSASSVSADTQDRDLLLATYPILGSRIAPTAAGACAVCHTSSIPNLNPYGAAYFSGGRFNASSLTAIENVDSDGDGFTNIQELRAFTYPGNASDFPVAATATSTAIQPPTATRTNTTVPSATRTSTTAPSATKGPSATSAPSSTLGPPTATRAASATKASTSVGATEKPRPTMKASPTPKCLRDNQTSSKSNEDDRRGRNRCPKGSHEDPRELEKENMVSRLQAIYARPQPAKNH